MAVIHNLGFPRIGAKRELKFAQEAYWKGLLSREDLLAAGRQLRKRHWELQGRLDFVPVGDFSFYDQVLDASFLLGNVPDRVLLSDGDSLDRYFRLARGRSAADSACCGVQAGEMTKWFDTNYHYLVPELDASSRFDGGPDWYFEPIREALARGRPVKPVLVGPLTFLRLSKAAQPGFDRLTPDWFNWFGQPLPTIAIAIGISVITLFRCRVVALAYPLAIVAAAPHDPCHDLARP